MVYRVSSTASSKSPGLGSAPRATGAPPERNAKATKQAAQQGGREVRPGRGVRRQGPEPRVVAGRQEAEAARLRVARVEPDANAGRPPQEVLRPHRLHTCPSLPNA